MTGMEMEGFDELADEFEELANRAERLEGEQEVPLEELLTPQFMRRYTEFESVDAMLEASDWEVETQEDFEAIPEGPWDAFVVQHTDFRDWQSMLDQAGQEWATRQLGLD